MMIPFMGIQSAVMAEQFGTMFQYGKRRISAMSNEEFNAMTPKILQERITSQIQDMIPEMRLQIQAMRPMVTIIMNEFAEYVRLATEAIAKGGSEYLEHAAHGHIFGHGDTYVAPTETSMTQWEKDQLAKFAETTTATPLPQEPTTATTSTIAQYETTLTGEKTPIGHRENLEQAIENDAAAIQKFIIDNPDGRISGSNYPEKDYQIKMSQMLSQLSGNQTYYHDLYGVWYQLKTEIT